MSDVICIECGSVAKLVTGRDIYPHRMDLWGKSFYRCKCGAYCGCHPGSTSALGFPCGAETRRERSRAHAAFDPLWRTGTFRRNEAYGWLANQRGMSRKDCHIGMMTAAQAREATAHALRLQQNPTLISSMEEKTSGPAIRE